MREYLDFEKPIAEIEEKIEKLAAAGQSRPGVQDDLRKLRAKLYQLQAEIYARLTPWQRTQVARHPQRPSTLDYIGRICDSFLELPGDRLAETFNKPVITFIDTPGAYPGIGAEERGQAEAIAKNLQVMASLRVPIVSVVIGEGGSGGALAIGVADRLLMLQHAVYSVISPEGCAAILWDDPKKTPDAAEALKMTAEDLLRLGVIDEILPEPPGAAHRDPTAICGAVKKAVEAHLSALLELPLDELLQRRFKKYRRMGVLGGE